MATAGEPRPGAAQPPGPTAGPARWASFRLADLEKLQDAGDDAYYEFLRVSDLNCGLYVLPAGGEDFQEPHAEDEVYYVLRGRGRFFADGDSTDVGPGSLLYVRKGIEHRFHSISEELRILVFFAGGGPA